MSETIKGQEMKVPDKLVFDEATFSDIGIFGVEGEVEYIRKEALIEWLMDEMDKSEKFSTCEHYSNVIDHLEEM